MASTSRIPRIGDAAPDFELAALNEERVGLWDGLLHGPLYLEFLRGTWCPNARRRFDEIEAVRERLRGVWTRPLLIICEDPFTARRYFARRPTPLTVLLDTERRAARDYGVWVRFGLDGWNIARPASFLVDRAGFVRWRFVSRNQTQSAALDEILEQAAILAAEGRGRERPRDAAREEGRDHDAREDRAGESGRDA